jgi:hypothetical protein
VDGGGGEDGARKEGERRKATNLTVLLVSVSNGLESVTLSDHASEDLALLECRFESLRSGRNVRLRTTVGKLALVRVGATGEVVGGGLTGKVGVTEGHLRQTKV